MVPLIDFLSRGGRAAYPFFVLAVVLSGGVANAQNAALVTIRDCQDMLRTGKYEECLAATSDAVERRSYGEDWPILKATAEFQLGRYQAAAETLEAGVVRYSWSVRLRMQWYDLCPILGQQQRAEQLVAEVNQLASTSPWRYTDADDLVALGKAAIALGADPKDVLQGFFERARRNYESRLDGYLAAGELAIEKGDFGLAAELLRPAAERFPDNPDICFALATAVRSAVPEEAAELTNRCLEINPKYAAALLQLAGQQIDAEEYAAAEITIKRIHRTNPADPDSHALMAVMHHLHHRPEAERESRRQALQASAENPRVDHKIGTRLSRKYRFREGAEYQRRALKIDPSFLPAKAQLAQDLLRLGEDAAGWKLAEEAQETDSYDTTLFNLMQLKDSLDNFVTRETDRFTIRMTKSESAIYGQRVEALLSSAFDVLTEKYGYVPEDRVVVEIFDRPDDFAVRTFAMPDVAGFLGVCFGRLITANSPASMRENPNNWESVLWHEFCHVITLQMTGNRIPRWLSEGISVYEERLRDDRWGQSMTPVFRERIQADNVTPVSQLSSAFLKAGSGEDLNFAYYESSMVVQFIVQQHGFEVIVSILQNLNQGLSINDALERHAGGLQELDKSFSAHLRQLADEYAPDVKFAAAGPAADDSATPVPDEVTTDERTNYTEGLNEAVIMVQAERWDAAVDQLLQLIELYPQDASRRSARVILASVFELQGKTKEKAAVLAEHLQWAADDIEAVMQLVQLQIEAEDWEAAFATVQLGMAIDPLQPTLLRSLLEVSLQMRQNQQALQALSGLLELEPADAARTHFRMAEILKPDAAAEARRHVLLALEQAPRYRDAHRLLLELIQVPDESADVTGQ